MIPIQAITDPRLTALDVRVLAFIQCYGMLSHRKIGEAIGVCKSSVTCSIKRLKNTNYMAIPVANMAIPVAKNGLHKETAFKKLLYINKENEGGHPSGQMEIRMFLRRGNTRR